MSIAHLLTMPCTLIERRVVRDEHGEPVTDEFGNEVAEDHETATYDDDTPLLCRYEPARRTEHDEAGEISEARGRVWLLDKVDVRTVDAIRIDGLGAFQVVGEPGVWRGSRHATNDHIELTVERTAGGEEETDEGGS